MISFDIESCGVRSNAVVLSIGIVKFSMEDKAAHDNLHLSMKQRYEYYLATSLFVKLDAQEQFGRGRTMDKDAMEWWKKQGEYQRNRSLAIAPGVDVSAEKALARIKEYSLKDEKQPTVWQRGSLDNIVFDDWCREMTKEEPPFDYWQWMDFRTALALTKESVKRGYCNIPNFDNEACVIKHDPVHDAAYDVMMLLYGV